MPTSTNRMPVSPSRHASAPHERGHHERARERRERDDGALEPEQQHRAHRGEARAARDAEDVGARERVAQGGLEERTAEPERRARDDRGGHARQAQPQDHELGLRRPLADEGGEHVADPEAGGAEQQRGGRGREGQERGDRDDGRRATVPARPAGRDPHGEGVDRARSGPRASTAGRGGHSDAPFVRRTRAMSTGAPTIAATMPASSSAGATTTRPMTSAASSTIAPSTAASGVIHR